MGMNTEIFVLISGKTSANSLRSPPPFVLVCHSIQHVLCNCLSCYFLFYCFGKQAMHCVVFRKGENPYHASTFKQYSATLSYAAFFSRRSSLVPSLGPSSFFHTRLTTIPEFPNHSSGPDLNSRLSLSETFFAEKSPSGRPFPTSSLFSFFCSLFEDGAVEAG